MSIFDVLRHSFCGFDRFIAVILNGAGQALDQHFTDPRHLFRGRMDTEEIADAVPDGGNPPGHLVPQP